MESKKLFVYDTTLREGSQSAGTSFTIDDKLGLIRLLDDMGADFIEAGNPASNIKDVKLFEALRGVKLEHSKLAAFGSTCRAGVAPEDDYNISALLAAGTPVVCVFGKSSLFHVKTVLRCTPEENVELISKTVGYLKKAGREVVFDAEHFFDGCAQDKDYALATILAAKSAGADWICLCDTNGGSMVRDISRYTALAENAVGGALGIHCHNDTGLAAANTIEAVLSGAKMLQTTLCGWGERCGNADFFTVIPDLQLKLGYGCVSGDVMKKLHGYCSAACTLANRSPDKSAPYVGNNAFSHKAGMHIDAVNKDPKTFEHVDPAQVGASRNILLSEVSGRGAVLQKVRSVVPEMTKDAPFISDVVDKLKSMEMNGYQFESADASFELLVRRMLGLHDPFFSVADFKVVAAQPAEAGHTATAMIRVHVDGKEEITAADGDGPVNALDLAVRKALERFYPSLGGMKLSDYKVRVLDSHNATASMVRVVIESRDQDCSWTTMGVHADVLQASFNALIDSLEYKLLKDKTRLAK